MSKEGFLIAHEEDARSFIYYCVLGEGKFQFFSKRHSGVLVREIVLSKSKLKIRGVPDDEARDCAFSFTVHMQRSKIKDGRQFVFGKPLLLLLSAPTWGERKAWGNAIHAWQRNYWGEPQHLESRMDDEETDAFFIAQQRSLESALEAAALTPSFSKGSALFASDSNSSSSSTVASLSPSASSSSRAAEDAGLTGGAAAGEGGKNSSTKAAAAVSRMFFSRAQAVKTMGSKVGKKIRSKSSAVTFSLPPMGLSIASSVQQPQPH